MLNRTFLNTLQIGVKMKQTGVEKMVIGVKT